METTWTLDSKQMNAEIQYFHNTVEDGVKSSNISITMQILNILHETSHWNKTWVMENINFEHEPFYAPIE